MVARLKSQCDDLDGGCADASAPEDAADAEDAEDTLDAQDGSTAEDARPPTDADAAPDAPDAEPPPGCSARVCGALASAATWCSSAGVAVQAGDSCASDSGPLSMRHALCSCRDLVSKSTFTADAFLGTLQRPVADAAAIGVNNDLSLTGSGNVDGEISFVNRRVLSDGMQVDSVVQVSTPPCRCEPKALLDIGALVQTYKQNNDNAREGLSSGALDAFTEAKELSLPCGRYYFTRMKSEFPLTLRTRGNVAIFVEENIELNEALRILTDDDTSQVSVFVAGDARVRGSFALSGDPNAKARVNLYVQGTGTLLLGAAATMAGQLYAPRAELVNSGNFQLYGSVFVDRVNLGATLNLHYDTGGANPAKCE